MADLDWSRCPAVESVSGKVSGDWVLRGTRMPVSTILSNIEAGATIDQILQWFDGLNRDQVKAVINFAYPGLSAAVRKGLAEADRGELIEEEEMDQRVKRMLKK